MSPSAKESAPSPIYQGKYCKLLPLSLDDALLYEHWLSNESFQAYHPLLKRVCPTLRSIHLHILNVQAEHSKIREVVIWHQSAEVPIGLVSLSAIDEMNGKAELSVAVIRFLGSRCMWEAVHACITLSFEHLRLYKLIFHVNPRNLSLCKLLLRNGFTQEGLLQKEIEVEPGRRIDLVRFALFRATYRDTPLMTALQRIVPISI